MKKSTSLILAISLLLFLQGCYFTAVPLTIREIRDYTMPSKQTVSAPISRVARAACLSLHEMGFTLKRVEYRTDPAVIQSTRRRSEPRARGKGEADRVR